MPATEVVTTDSRPDLHGQAKAAFREGWPAFVLRDPLSARYRQQVNTYFSRFDVLGTAFPRTGHYVVPGALDLVEIDCERDQGRYAETNLWMRHL